MMHQILYALHKPFAGRKKSGSTELQLPAIEPTRTTMDALEGVDVALLDGLPEGHRSGEGDGGEEEGENGQNIHACVCVCVEELG